MSLSTIYCYCCLVANSCPTLWDPIDFRVPGFPILHYFPEFAQTHALWVSDAIQPSQPLTLLLLPVSGCFSVSQLLASGGQGIGTSVSASVLLINIQSWFPLGLTDLISLQSKGLSRVFCNTTVQKHQSFSAQPSLWQKVIHRSNLDVHRQTNR